MANVDDRDYYIDQVVDGYIANNEIKIADLIDDKSMTAQTVRTEIVSRINEQLLLANQMRSKDNKIKYLQSLPGYVVAKILIATGDVKVRVGGKEGYRIIAKHYYKNFNTNGVYRWSGIYSKIMRKDYTNVVMRALSLLCPDANTHDEDTLFRYISCHAPRVSAKKDDKAVFCRNGVWDYRSKTFTAYDDPDFDSKYGHIIMMKKLAVNHPYGPDAVLKPDGNGVVEEPIYHNDKDDTDWRPSEAFTAPFEIDTDQGRASHLMIEQLGQFTIRGINGQPQIMQMWVDAGGKGMNGKSTTGEFLCRLFEKKAEDDDEDLMTPGRSVANVCFEDLDKPYALAKDIETIYMIMGTESNGATKKIENCAKIKDLMRAQEVEYRNIREESFSFAFNGGFVQQINKAPIFAEKSDSMLSHMIQIPFVNCFGDRRAYVKDDYIQREESAEWLLYHYTVELPCYDEYDAEAMEVLKPFKREMLISGMTSAQALEEIVPGLRMNFMPTELLYDLYLRWCDKNGVVNKISQKSFREDMKTYAADESYNVSYTEKTARVSIKDITEKHPAMLEFGSSDKAYMTEFAKQGSPTYVQNYDGQLNADKFKSKLWTKGGLLRTVKWQDMPKNDLVAEIDEDNI